MSAPSRAERAAALLLVVGFVAATSVGLSRPPLTADDVLALDAARRPAAATIATPIAHLPRGPLETLLVGAVGGAPPRALPAAIAAVAVLVTFRVGQRLYGTPAATAAGLLLAALPPWLGLAEDVARLPLVPLATVAALLLVLPETRRHVNATAAGVAILGVLVGLVHPIPGAVAAASVSATARLAGRRALRPTLASGAGVAAGCALLLGADAPPVGGLPFAFDAPTLAEASLGWWLDERLPEPALPALLLVIALLAAFGVAAPGPGRPVSRALAAGAVLLPLVAAATLGRATTPRTDLELALLALPGAALLAGRGLATPARARFAHARARLVVTSAVATALAAPLAALRVAERWSAPGPPIATAARFLARYVEQGDVVLLDPTAALLLPQVQVAGEDDWWDRARTGSLPPFEAECGAEVLAVRGERLVRDEAGPRLCRVPLRPTRPVGGTGDLADALGQPGRKWIVRVEGERTVSTPAWDRVVAWAAEVAPRTIHLVEPQADRRAAADLVADAVRIVRVDDRLVVDAVTAMPAERRGDPPAWRFRPLADEDWVVRLVDPTAVVERPSELLLAVDDYGLAARFEDPEGGGWVVTPHGGPFVPHSLRFVHPAADRLGLRVLPIAGAEGNRVPVLLPPGGTTSWTQHVPVSGTLVLELGLEGATLPATWQLTDQATGARLRIPVPAGVPSWIVDPALPLLPGTHRFALALDEADAVRYAAGGRLAPLAWLRADVRPEGTAP